MSAFSKGLFCSSFFLLCFSFIRFWFTVTLVANWESLLRELSMKEEKFWLFLVETAFQFKYKILLIKSLICLRLNRLATWSAVLICHQRDLFTQINPFTAGMKTQSKVVTVCRNFYGLWLLKHWKIRIAYRQWRSHKGMCACIHRKMV